MNESLFRELVPAVIGVLGRRGSDFATAEETDWPQIVEWYDDLVRLTGTPVARLNRAVAVGESHDPQAGLAALSELDPTAPRHTRQPRRTCTSVRGTRPRQRGSTPKPPDRRPTSPNATTSRDRPPD